MYKTCKTGNDERGRDTTGRERDNESGRNIQESREKKVKVVRPGHEKGRRICTGEKIDEDGFGGEKKKTMTEPAVDGRSGEETQNLATWKQLIRNVDHTVPHRSGKRCEGR